MSYLIDTCIISEFVKKKPNAYVRSWFNQQLQTELLSEVVAVSKKRKYGYSNDLVL